MGLDTEASAALVFLILYAILFLVLFTGYVTRRLRLGSRHTVVFLHVTVRLASQATGLAFGIVGYKNIHLLVAYFILGAEGYFTLVLCTYRYLISWQNHNTASHSSWLEPRRVPGTPWYSRLRDSFTLLGSNRRPMSVIHYLLIVANAIIISGASQITGGAKNVTEFNATLGRAKAMRAAGQAIFLSMTLFLGYCIVDTIKQCKRERSGKVHPTLWVLFAAWPLLIVRGVYGVLSPVLPAFNYFALSNYDDTGLTDAFVISEYIMGTSMEWTSCALLMLTYATSLHDPKTADLKVMNEVDPVSKVGLGEV